MSNVEYTDNSISQSIQLNQGWNFISFSCKVNLTELINSGENTILEIKNNIKSWSKINVDNGLGFLNSLSEIENTTSYFIKTNSEKIITVSGFEINNISLDLKLGYNYFPYPFKTSRNLDYFQVPESQLDIFLELKNTQQAWTSTNVKSGLSFLNSLQNLNESLGYFLKVSQDITVVFQNEDIQAVTPHLCFA